MNVELNPETMTSNVRVTYLITTRNRAEFLERTLQNVAEFITVEDELIVIDGASDDDTKEVVARHANIVSSFISEPDTCEAHAFNKGLFRAQGRLIKPITDDDYFYPEAILEAVRIMESMPEIDALFAGGEMWRLENGTPKFIGYRRLPVTVEATPLSIFDHVHIGLGLLMRRQTIERIGGVCGSYASVDGDITCSLIECNCNIRYLDVDMYKWFIYPHSGFNKHECFHRDYFFFNMRLNRWAEAFATSPTSLRQTRRLLCKSTKTQSRDAELTYALSFAAKLARGPRSVIGSLVRRAIRGSKQFFERTYRSDDVHAPNNATECLWSGRLR